MFRLKLSSKIKIGLFYIISGIVLCLNHTVSAIDTGFYSSNDILFSNPDDGVCSTASDESIDTGGGGGLVGLVKVPKDFSLGNEKGKRAANLVKQLMTDYNLKDFQAAGIVGNFMVESGGNHLPPNVNEGGSAGPPRFSGGYGWAQWTGGRQSTFIAFAVSNGYMKSKSVDATDAANYAYLSKELTGGEGKVMPAIQKTTNVNDAVIKWEAEFERAGKPALGERANRAKLVLDAVRSGKGLAGSTGTTTLDGTDSESTSSCSTSASDAGTNPTAQSTKFDKVVFPLSGGRKVLREPGIFKNGTTSRGGHPYIAFDILAHKGDEVIALTDGVVTNTSVSSLGQSVTVYNAKSGLALFYQHMQPTDYAKKGTQIKAGDHIGKLTSEKEFSGAVTPHLHIDASHGKFRVPCSRSSCSASAKSKFVDIGPDLFNAYEKLPK